MISFRFWRKFKRIFSACFSSFGKVLETIIYMRFIKRVRTNRITNSITAMEKRLTHKERLATDRLCSVPNNCNLAMERFSFSEVSFGVIYYNGISECHQSGLQQNLDSEDLDYIVNFWRDFPSTTNFFLCSVAVKQMRTKLSNDFIEPLSRLLQRQTHRHWSLAIRHKHNWWDEIAWIGRWGNHSYNNCHYDQQNCAIVHYYPSRIPE